MSQTITYTASVYSRTITYTNFKGETKTVELHFSLDPMQLLQVFSSFQPKKSRSQNPSKRGQDEELTDEQQVKFIKDIVIRSAGFPSQDGESWEPFEDFENTIAGKAFLTKLTSSDLDREQFAKTVVIDPFKAFVSFAEADETNTPSEVQQLKQMVAQMENIFQPADKTESVEERRARLEAEMAALNASQSA